MWSKIKSLAGGLVVTENILRLVIGVQLLVIIIIEPSANYFIYELIRIWSRKCQKIVLKNDHHNIL